MLPLYVPSISCYTPIVDVGNEEIDVVELRIRLKYRTRRTVLDRNRKNTLAILAAFSLVSIV